MKRSALPFAGVVSAALGPGLTSLSRASAPGAWGISVTTPKTGPPFSRTGRTTAGVDVAVKVVKVVQVVAGLCRGSSHGSIHAGLARARDFVGVDSTLVLGGASVQDVVVAVVVEYVVEVIVE